MAWFGGGGGNWGGGFGDRVGNMMGGLGDRLLAGGHQMNNPYTQGTGGAYGRGGGGGFMDGGGGGGGNYGVPANYWQGRMPTREGFQQLRTGMGAPMQRGGLQQAPGNMPMPFNPGAGRPLPWGNKTMPGGGRF